MPRYSNLKMKPNLQSDVFLLCDKNKNISTDLSIKNKSLSFKGRDKALKHIKHYASSCITNNINGLEYPVGSIKGIIQLEANLASKIAEEYNFICFDKNKMLLNTAKYSNIKRDTSSLEDVFAGFAFNGISCKFKINDLRNISNYSNKEISKYKVCELVELFGNSCINVCENWTKSKICTSMTTDEKKEHKKCIEQGIIPDSGNINIESYDDGVYVEPTNGCKAYYWNSKEYRKYVDDWNELYDSGQIGHGWTPPPPPVYNTSNGASRVPEGEKAKDDSNVDQYGNKKSYYKTESYHKYVDDWNELYDSGQIGHGWTPPPPPNYGPY